MARARRRTTRSASRPSSKPSASTSAKTSTRRGKKKLGRGKRAATGIEIGAYSVKIVTLMGDDAGEIDIRKITVMPLAEASGAEYPEEMHERQKDALKEAAKQHGRMDGAVVLGFPRDLVTIRYLTLPSADLDELKEMLYFDVERHVPFTIDEVELSFQVLEKTAEHESKIMLVCVPKREIEPYVEMCNELGIDVDQIDLDVLGDCEAYTNSVDPEQTVALVNFGRSSVKLSILNNNQMQFSRSLPITEHRLLEGFPGAKTWKDLQGRVTAAGALNPNERDHFAQWVEQLSLELMRSVSSYSCENDAVTIDRMILLGGAGYFPSGPPSGLNMRIKTNTTIEPPLSGEIPAGDGYHGCTVATPTGLAIRALKQNGFSLNLMPEVVVQKRDQKYRSTFRTNVFILVLMISILLGATGYCKWYEYYLDYSQLDQLHKQHLPGLASFKKMEKRVETVEQYLDADNSCVNIIKSILEILPQKCYINNLSFNKRNSLDFILQVPRDEDWQKISQQLNILAPPGSTEKYFSKIKPTRTQKKLDLLATEMDVWEISVHCDLNYEEKKR
jgi:type IV pilus assembly protein PilM